MPASTMRRWVGPATKRHLGVPAIVLLAGCGLFSGPEVTDEYVLTHIGGRPMPAPIVEFVAVVDGDTSYHRTDLLWGTMTFWSDGDVQQRSEAVNVHDDVPEDTIQQGRLDGRYDRAGDVITIRFRHPQGWADSVKYSVREGGRVLVGFQDLKVQEYERKN